MTFLLCLVCAVFVWGLMLRWARREIDTARAEAEDQAWYWHGQAMAARRQLARMIRDATVREQAWRQGRDDVIAIVPLINTARSQDAPPPDEQEGAA